MSTPTLYEHQMYVLGLSMDEKSYAYFMETGTGKTITAIENAKYLWETEKINFLIILAPKLVCEAVWEIELERYRQDMPYRLFKWIGGISNLDKYVMGEVVKQLSTEFKRARILPIFLINSESFSHAKISNLVGDVLRRAKCMMIVDESTTFKNHKASRTQALLKLSHLAHYKRILSGYPILRSPEDLYTQILFLGRNLIPYQSFYAFRNEFCNTRTMGRVQATIGFKNLGRLSDLIQPFSIRILKKDCLDLPDKIRTKRYIEMSGPQRELYVQMRDKAYMELEDCEEPQFALTFLTQLNKLHQVANGLLLNPRTDIPNYKYDYMLEMLETEVSDQATIWFWFTESLKKMEGMIRKKFGKYSVVTIHGDVPMTERVISLRLFQEGKVRFLLANPASAMHGLNLTNCSYVTYFNNSTHLEHRIQSEDRFHRIGQVNHVLYTDMVTQGTVEDKILTQLQKNHKIGAEVLRDEWKQWFS